MNLFFENGNIRKIMVSGKSWVVLVIVVLLSGCSGPKPELIGDLPLELQEKLVAQEGHIPYYFPSREEFGSLTDGEYTGLLSGSMIDKGEVLLTVSDGEISDIEIVSITLWAPTVRKEKRVDEIYEGLPAEVLARQSPLVDSVTAATGTSHVFKICVTRALWQASEKDDPMADYAPY